MLAYVFWHRPADGSDAAAYENAVEHFHRSLAARPPDGFEGSACFRAEQHPGFAGPGYEDWYLVDDFAALGVLNEAAVGRGHRTAHDTAARHTGDGAAGVYRLLEGGAHLASVELAVWVQHQPGAEPPLLGALLGDGMDPRSSGLWRRQLVLGPGPEYCVLAAEQPAGTRPGRLADGWRAEEQTRAVVWGSERHG
jgi:hypothetical protein